MNTYNFYRLIGFTLISIALLTSCELEGNIEGNGNVTTERRSTGDFDAIEISGVLNVYLSQEESPRLNVKTDENLMDIITTETINGTLYISTTDDDYNATLMDVYISIDNLSYLKLDGVTALYCEETLELDDLDIDKVNTGFMQFDTFINSLDIQTSGVGDLELAGKATDVKIDNNMVGDIFAYELKAVDMNLIHDGTGDIQIYVTDKLDVDLSGVGNIYCKGYPDEYNKTGSGVGKVQFID